MIAGNRNRRTLLTIWASLLMTGAVLAEEGGPVRASAAPDGSKLELVDKPDYRPHEPAKRGAKYKVPFGDVRQRALWGWRMELPDGSGLAFGGIATWDMQEVNGAMQRNDDPRRPTFVRRNGAWVSIQDDLRKNNPLQPQHDALLALRYPLKYLTSLARHIYLEGRDEATEKAFLDKRVAPKVAELVGKLKDARAALAKAGSTDAYCAGQVAFALGHFDKVSPAFEALGTRTSHDKLTALRQARISLEQAADALDAEPPARALSMPAYDAKTRLFVVFGGDHLDYLSNDLWVFDPKAVRWRQRHSKSAPEPRADHFLESAGAGKLKLRGGYIYPYVHVGPGEWVYDLASDLWSGPADVQALPADDRKYRTGSYLPDYFTEGLRPDAAAHEKVLAALPANTWVDLKPPKLFAEDRCWGTLAFDPDRDMIYFYNGGHSSYAGTSVVHYHLATNRWDQMVESEFPLGLSGASGMSAPGWSFNRRPWITNHLWNSYEYHPGLRRLILAGRFTFINGTPDMNTYLYDPDYGDWEKRVPNSARMSCMEAQVLWVPKFGMIEWGNKFLDEGKLDWNTLEIKGKLPGAKIDYCGFVYDPKRSRVLFFSGGTYGNHPYPGEVFALAIPSLEVTQFTPEGSEHIVALGTTEGRWKLREIAYHPDLDLFIFTSKLSGGYMVALDAKKNRWVGLKVGGPLPWGVSSTVAYDAKRDLFYSVGSRAEVYALRLDPKTLEIKTFAEIAAEKGHAGTPGK